MRLPDRGGDIVMALIIVRPAVSRVARTTTSHAPLLDGSVGAGVTHFGFDLCTKVYFLLPCTSKSCGAHTHEPAQAIVAEPWCAQLFSKPIERKRPGAAGIGSERERVEPAAVETRPGVRPSVGRTICHPSLAL